MEWFQNSINLIMENIKWIFSGIGVVLVTAIFKIFYKKKKKYHKIKMNQKSGRKSTNIQIGGDYNKYGK